MIKSLKIIPLVGTLFLASCGGTNDSDKSQTELKTELLKVMEPANSAEAIDKELTKSSTDSVEVGNLNAPE